MVVLPCLDGAWFRRDPFPVELLRCHLLLREQPVEEGARSPRESGVGVVANTKPRAADCSKYNPPTAGEPELTRLR